MTILITKQNIDFFKQLVPKAQFIERTNNTVTFNVNDKGFKTLYTKVKESGNNPYSVMAW